MQRQIVQTADGSHSVSIPEMNVTYHSIHGAIQESQHVFIEAGYNYWSGRIDRPDQLNILEMGFGTGLNALLTFAVIQQQKDLNVQYTAIELFPLLKEEYSQLNYCVTLNEPEIQDAFDKMHESEWEKDIAIAQRFSLLKTNQSLLQFKPARLFDLVYFDAFAPDVQPELWTTPVFELLYNNMTTGAVLVTYCAKGDVRRAMLAAGFTVEKIPGPPYKREMLRAVKK
jgi:tRNA U34 5-methylaminomethyl-2-thiouridine-forming methyltransferase MnmC